MVTLFIRGTGSESGVKFLNTPLCSGKGREMGQIDDKSNCWKYLPHFSYLQIMCLCIFLLPFSLNPQTWMTLLVGYDSKALDGWGVVSVLGDLT